MPPVFNEPYGPSEPDVMEIAGRLDDGTASNVEEDIRLCIESGARRMVLDCRDLSYISGAGLHTVLDLARMMQAAEGRLVLCGLQPQVEEMLEVSGFDAIIPVYKNRGEAIVALTW
jgi:anti-anti-sigma factor